MMLITYNACNGSVYIYILKVLVIIRLSKTSLIMIMARGLLYSKRIAVLLHISVERLLGEVKLVAT